jgi:hypothetical protein
MISIILQHNNYPQRSPMYPWYPAVGSIMLVFVLCDCVYAIVYSMSLLVPRGNVCVMFNVPSKGKSFFLFFLMYDSVILMGLRTTFLSDNGIVYPIAAIR